MGVVTGTFQLPNGSPVANGLYQWKLSGDAVLLSSAANVPRLFGGSLDSNGNMTATFNFNDVLQTSSGSSTTYQLTIKDSGQGQVWNESYYLTGTAANLNLVLPASSGSGPVFLPFSLINTATVAFSAFPTFTAAAPSQYFAMTLTANVTNSALVMIGFKVPILLFFQIFQDAIGGHSFTWPTNFGGGTTIDTSAPPSTSMSQIFFYDGSTTASAMGPGVQNP